MNLSQAASAVGVSRQRIHQIATKQNIGTARPSSGGKYQRWEFSQEDVEAMTADHNAWVYRVSPADVADAARERMEAAQERADDLELEALGYPTTQPHEPYVDELGPF